MSRGEGSDVEEAEPQDFGGMTKSCRARPAGGGHAFGVPAGRARQDLAASGGRRALSPAACASGDRPARRATGTSQDAGRGLEGEGGVSRGGRRTWRMGQEPQDFGGMTKSCRTRPAGGGCAALTRPGGCVRIWDRRAGGEPYRLRLRSGDRPARRATGTSQGAGRGPWVEREVCQAAVGVGRGGWVRSRRISAV